MEQKGTITPKFNLLPEKFYKKQKKRAKATDINIYGAAAIFVLISVAAGLIGFKYYMELSMQPDREIMASKWNEAVAMREVEWQARAIEERLDTLETLEMEEVELFNILGEIERGVDVEFSWINIEVNNSVSLSASVDSLQDGFTMLSQVSELETLGGFWADGVRQVQAAEGETPFVRVSFTVYPSSE